MAAESAAEAASLLEKDVENPDDFIDTDPVSKARTRRRRRRNGRGEADDSSSLSSVAPRFRGGKPPEADNDPDQQNHEVDVCRVGRTLGEEIFDHLSPCLA